MNTGHSSYIQPVPMHEIRTEYVGRREHTYHTNTHIQLNKLTQRTEYIRFLKAILTTTQMTENTFIIIFDRSRENYERLES